MEHILLPGVELAPHSMAGEHEAYLRGWLEEARRGGDSGNVAASQCLQGAFIELALFGFLATDWIGIFEAHLQTDDGRPMAYSHDFSKRLHKFDAQFAQPTIFAAHAKWWISACVEPSRDRAAEFTLMLSDKVANGWIYDHDISPTTHRHRMKSELTMSLAQGLELFVAANAFIGAADDFRSTLSDLAPTGYVSAEYFRVRSLEILDAVELMPVETIELLSRCAAQDGYCDFDNRSKVDAYMGTAKRIARDEAVPSPLAACQLQHIVESSESTALTTQIQERIAAYAEHLARTPMDIPAFQMRDLPMPFGADATPIEVLCASALITRWVQGQ